MRDEEKSVDGLSEFPVLWISQITEKRSSGISAFLSQVLI